MANLMRRIEGGIPDLRREIDRFFEDFFSPGTGLGHRQLRGFVPRLEITEREGGYLLRAELPGLRSEDVTIDIDDDVLVVHGERKREQTRKSGGYEYTECSYGGFRRSIQLPRGVDASKVRAEFKNGMLEVDIPVTETSRKRRIALAATGSTPVEVEGPTPSPASSQFTSSASRATGPQRTH
jgi:HSP20 family protein